MNRALISLATLALTLGLTTGLTTGCGTPLLEFDVLITDETVVEGGGGTVLPSTLEALGFDGFNDFDIEGSQAFENRDLTREHVVEASLTSFTLTAEAPSDADLGWLDEMQVFADAESQSETEVAELDVEGAPVTVAADTTDEDLASYLRTESFTLTAEAAGDYPDEDTTVEAEAILHIVADPTGTMAAPLN